MIKIFQKPVAIHLRKVGVGFLSEVREEKGADSLPLGDAKLAWSFNRDGQIKPELLEARDQRMGIDTDQVREQRKPLADLAKPQMGENAIEDALKESAESR